MGHVPQPYLESARLGLGHSLIPLKIRACPSLQADVQAVYDGCNAVRYNLSADAIQAIFKTHPIGP